MTAGGAFLNQKTQKMCEVITRVVIKGEPRLIQAHPEYEPPRFVEIQDCFLPMIEHLKREFPGTGTIRVVWDDDSTHPLSLETSEELQLHEVIDAWNRLEPSLPCLTELHSKK